MIKPLGKRVLVEVLAAADTTAGGLYIPDNAREKQQRGKVIACGSAVREVQVGDVVLFGRYAGTEVKPELHITLGDGLLMMNEDDLLAVDEE